VRGRVFIYAATGRSPFDASGGAAIMHRVLSEQPGLSGLWNRFAQNVTKMSQSGGRRTLLRGAP
jgi:hypothetical protein